MSSAHRPERTGHAALFYNEKEARKYDSSSRMIGVQREITQRAIELLRLPSAEERPCLILDVGCGSGLSGKALEEAGHVWMGCDVSRDMLNVAKERMDDKRERRRRKMGKKKGGEDAMEEDEDEDEDEDGSSSEEEGEGERLAHVGDLMHHDMGTGLPFRKATFDGCISISAIQWLCYSNASNQVPKKRLMRFFASLYQVLRRGARAVLQFYPETAEQAILISECAAKVGFAGGIVVDYPNSTKAKKHYLVLSFDKTYKAPSGKTGNTELPDGALLNHSVRVDGDHNGNKKQQLQGKKRGKMHKKKKGVKTKEWILEKKEMQRKKKGVENVRVDSKYTGRRRKGAF